MKEKILIWDLPLRIFHWALVLTVCCLWYTSDPELGLIEIHMKFGYFALSLVIFRIIWGFAGTKHSLFVNFIPSYTSAKQYLIDSKKGKTKTYLGHNPLGSIMVLIMLLLVLAQASSGLFINDDVFSAGPYYDTISNEAEKVLKFIHHNAFDVLLVAIFFHILAVVYYVKYKKQGLVSAMFHGRKTVTKDDSSSGIIHSKLLVAFIVAIVVVCFMYWLVVINIPVIEEYYW